MTYVPTQETMTVGGAVFTDLDNLKVLYMHINGSGAGKTGARLTTASAGYQVPTGQKLVLRALSAQCNVAGVFSLGYCDNDLGLASNTSPTNPFYIANNDYSLQMFVAATGTYTKTEFYMEIPASKYVFAFNNAGALVAGIFLYGYLKPA